MIQCPKCGGKGVGCSLCNGHGEVFQPPAEPDDVIGREKRDTRRDEREEETPADGKDPDAGRSDSGGSATGAIIGVLVTIIGILLTVIGTGLAGGTLRASQRQAAALERIAEAVSPCIPDPVPTSTTGTEL